MVDSVLRDCEHERREIFDAQEEKNGRVVDESEAKRMSVDLRRKTEVLFSFPVEFLEI